MNEQKLPKWRRYAVAAVLFFASALFAWGVAEEWFVLVQVTLGVVWLVMAINQYPN